MTSMRFGSFLLLVCLASQAATYYVSTTGDDDTGDGSYANPWRTYSAAFTNIAGGDTIYMRGGTYEEPMLAAYTELVFPSGSSTNNPTRWMGQPGETAIIDFIDATGTDASAAIRFGSVAGNCKSNLWISGLSFDFDDFDEDEVTNPTGLFFGCNENIWITNCVFENLPAGYGMVHTSYNKSTFAGGVTNFNLLGCTFNNWSYGTIARKDFPHATYLAALNNSTVADNTFYANAVNTVLYSGSLGLHLSSTGASTDWGYNNTVERNLVAANNTPAFWQGQRNGSVFRNNVIIALGATYAMRGWSDNNTLVANNTIVGGSYGLMLSAYGPILSNSFVNNLFVNQSVQAIRVLSGIGENQWDTNLVTASIVDLSAAQVFDGTITTNAASAGVVNYTVYPYDLRPSNTNVACANVGATLADVTSDYVGTARPQGAGYDIGAYELVEEPPLPIPDTLSVRKNLKGRNSFGGRIR